MKVFISWSGSQSHQVALLLRDWLPTVIQQIKPWVSSEDISKGSTWLAEIDRELATTERGIVCVTPGNEHAPWLNYEAGALTKETGQHRVCVALLGIEATDVTGPLRNFQATRLLEREDVLKLVKTLNADLPDETRLSNELLEHSFDREWEALSQGLTAIKAAPESAESLVEKRSDRELLEETLDLVRALSRGAVAEANVRDFMSEFDRDYESTLVAASGPRKLTRASGADLIDKVGPGDQVRHRTFGIGTIISTEGSDQKTVASIDFGRHGVKRLLMRYAPLNELDKPEDGITDQE